MTYLVGLAGPKEVGKSTTARRFIEYFGTKYDVKVMSFSSPLYEICSTLTGESVDWLKSNKDYVWRNGSGFLYNWTPRKLLQYVGTDLLRDNLAKSIWIDIALKNAKKSKLDIVVFDDCRFDNEVAALDLVIELFRDGVKYTSEHLTEMGGLSVDAQMSIQTEGDIINLSHYILKQYEASK